MNFAIEPSSLGRIVVPSHLPDGVALFYTTLDFTGFLEEGGAERVEAVVRERFGLDASLSTCVQVHGATVVRAGSKGGWQECDSCDALWTDSPNVALGIKVADCLPVTMIDARHGVVGNVHSGWRGTAQRITEETLDALTSASAFSAADAMAFLGPSIRACCFEVGEEVVDRLQEAYGDLSPWVDRSRSRPHVDVAGITHSRLVTRGFRPERIVDSRLCTRCEGSIFHSYRRDGRSSGRGGRNLAVVAR